MYVQCSVNATSLSVVLVGPGGVGEVVLDGLGGVGVLVLEVPGGAMELVLGGSGYVVQRYLCFPVQVV